jgi:hypothetical protein
MEKIRIVELPIPVLGEKIGEICWVKAQYSGIF